jgi:hypothetical protein
MTMIIEDLFEESVSPQHNLGELYVAPNGSKYRYTRAGAVALVAGDLQQSAAEDTNYSSMAVQAAAAIGAVKIPVTLGGTAVTSGQFDEGILVVSKVTGIGQYFNIVRHDVQTSTTGTCNFYVDRPLKVALDTTSTVTVMKNPYDDIIIHPTTSTGKAVGVALTARTIAYYGWVQSGGLAACLGDATASTAANQALSPSVSTAGAVTKAVTLAQRVGTSYPVASVSAEVQPVFLEID